MQYWRMTIGILANYNIVPRNRHDSWIAPLETLTLRVMWWVLEPGTVLMFTLNDRLDLQATNTTGN